MWGHWGWGCGGGWVSGIIIIVSCLVYRGGMDFEVIVGVIIMNTICLV
jgi:hypothetical protein